MDNNNFWCHDVPDNMPEAFNIVQNSLNSSNPNPLFRFSANNYLSSSMNNNLNTNPSNDFNKLNSTFSGSSPINDQVPILNNNWKTINNLSTASSLIAPYKRKSLVEEDDLAPFQPPIKQNATEEKVIGRLNKLSIDEKFDSDEFVLALDNDELIDEDLNELDGNENVIDFETDDILDEDKNVHFELAEEVQDYFNCDDVITKLVKEQCDKNSKALVIWQPKLTLTPFDNKENKKSKELIDQTDEYTVTEESDDEDIIEDKDTNLEIDEYCKPIEITEINELDTSIRLEEDQDMMEI